MDQNIVQAYAPTIDKRPSALEELRTDAALTARLIRAFMEISTQEDRMKVVQLAEELLDPIWDY